MGLNAPGIDFQWGGGGARFSATVHTGLEAPLCTGYRISLPGVKQLGRGVDHHHPPSGPPRHVLQ
jgi:hypothetical protein